MGIKLKKKCSSIAEYNKKPQNSQLVKKHHVSLLGASTDRLQNWIIPSTGSQGRQGAEMKNLVLTVNKNKYLEDPRLIVVLRDIALEVRRPHNHIHALCSGGGQRSGHLGFPLHPTIRFANTPGLCAPGLARAGLVPVLSSSHLLRSLALRIVCTRPVTGGSISEPSRSCSATCHDL